jgi:hypothetical protein
LAKRNRGKKFAQFLILAFVHKMDDFFIFAADGKKLTRARVTFYPSFASATDQGDQMSLRKNRPKCSPKHFLPKIVHNQYLGKK